MKLITAGESHGKGLFAIIEGLPSHLTLDIDEIDRYLALRQGGYGRGARQKIERDKVEILSGVRNLQTLGSPVAFAVYNRDYQNWQEYMAPEGCDTSFRTLTRVRPGHADLTGCIKYGQEDARNILERASARETAIRVAAGTIARQYLRALGIQVSGYVRTVCGVNDKSEYSFGMLESAKSQPLFMLNELIQEKAIAKIDNLRSAGDTAGGLVEIRVHGLKPGFGSCMQYDKKLDAVLAMAVMSVQAIKGVSFGVGFDVAKYPGSWVHDEIFSGGGRIKRMTNRAGGIEGGMSNGEDIVIHAAMKPIPTLMKGLQTIDILTGQPAMAASERSDVTAICAAEIILESVVCTALADVVADRLGGDQMREVVERYQALRGNS